MWPHWARGVFVEAFLRAIVLSSYRDFDGRRWCKHFLPRAKKKVWLAVARRWAVMSTSRVVYRRNEDSHPARRHYRTALGRQGKSPSNAKTMTAAAWSVKPNWWCFRKVMAKGYGSGLPYGVRLLVLAAEWSPQAFLGG